MRPVKGALVALMMALMMALPMMALPMMALPMMALRMAWGMLCNVGHAM
jgi:hypothetical protein